MNSAIVNVDWMKVYVIQIINRIMMNVGVSVKNEMIGILAKIIISRILVHVITSVIRHVKLINIKTLKIIHAKNVYLMK